MERALRRRPVPHSAAHHRTERFSYRDTSPEADVSYAFGYLGDQMIQFIVQHDETPSIYREMYRAGEEGFHHTAILVHDFPAERQRMLEAVLDDYIDALAELHRLDAEKLDLPSYRPPADARGPDVQGAVIS